MKHRPAISTVGKRDELVTNCDQFMRRIITVRSKSVMIDRDLAEMYRVELRAFNQAVRRNLERFPDNFMFEVDKTEIIPLITNCDLLEKSRYWPQKSMVFTEQGIAMLSAVLRSDIAIETSIRIVNAFVAMRKTLSVMAPTFSNGELAESDFEAFGRQYGKLTKSICGICHDRFIIVDRKEIFAIGASLKDAGRLTFAVVKSGPETISGLLENLRKATKSSIAYG